MSSPNTVPDQKPWIVYIAQCADSSYYTGISTDVAARIRQHNLGNGAKYTRGRGPIELVYSEQLQNHSEALKRECELKRLRREEKIALIQESGAV